jgi:hypothetical protein
MRAPIFMLLLLHVLAMPTLLLTTADHVHGLHRGLGHQACGEQRVRAISGEGLRGVKGGKSWWCLVVPLCVWCASLFSRHTGGDIGVLRSDLIAFFRVASLACGSQQSTDVYLNSFFFMHA